MRKSISAKNITGFSVVLLLVLLSFCCGCVSQSILVTQKGGCNLKIISTEPESPATLRAGQKVYVNFKYDMGNYESVQIWARPLTNGASTGGYRAHGSPVYNKYDGAKGVIQGYFFFDDPVVVDEIIVRMRDKNSSDYVCVAKKDVNFEWKGSIHIKASLHNGAWDEEILALANKTKDEFASSEKHTNDGVLIYRIRSEDGNLSRARTEFHWTGKGRGGYRPDSIGEGQRKVIFERNGQPAELRVIHPGYHEFRRPIVFEKGKIIVWDDIFLECVSPEESCTIKGTVFLEDDANPKGIGVSSGDTSTTTDEKGNFILKGLRSGQVRMGARKPGYQGLYGEVNLSKGQTATCKLSGYRIRKAKVRWAYQPDGSKNFDNDNIITGTAVLQDRLLNRVSFVKGFKQVCGQSDFFVYQRKDRLILKNFDVRGKGGPTILEIDNAFDEATTTKASDLSHTYQAYTLKAGKVYIFRCYDGQHYAKMEVLEIID